MLYIVHDVYDFLPESRSQIPELFVRTLVYTMTVAAMLFKRQHN